MISVACPSCQKIYKVDESVVGKRVKCAGCGTAFEIGAKEPQPVEQPAASEVKQAATAEQTGYGIAGEGATWDQTERAPQAPPPIPKKAQAGVANASGPGVTEKAKVATQDAKHALKILLADPAGGQSIALELLGDGRAVGVGLLFVGIFVLTGYLAGREQLAQLFGMYRGMGGSEDLETHLKLVLAAAIPPAAFLAGLVLIGKIFGGKISFHSGLFCSGVALLPASIALVGVWLLGEGNVELMGVIAFFAAIITILLVNSGLTGVQRLSATKAMLLTPTLVILSCYISKVLYMRVFS